MSETILNDRLQQARVVWAKFGSYPWWPCKYVSKKELVDEISAAKTALRIATSSREKKQATSRIRDLEGLKNRAKKRKVVVVRFYGDDSMTLVGPDKVKPFEKHFQQYAPQPQIWGKKYLADEDGELYPAEGSPMDEAQKVRCSYCMKCDGEIAEEDEDAVGCNNCQAWTHIHCTNKKEAPDTDDEFYCTVCQQDLGRPEVLSSSQKETTKSAIDQETLPETPKNGRKRKREESGNSPDDSPKKQQSSFDDEPINERLKNARVVWVKFGSYPWWPSQYLSGETLASEINDLKEERKEVRNAKQKKSVNQKIKRLESLLESKTSSQVLVRFYGNASVSLVAPEKIKPFEKFFKQYAQNSTVWGKKFRALEDGSLVPAPGSPMAEAQEVRCLYCMACDKYIPEDEVDVVGCNNCQAWTHISCTKKGKAPLEAEDFFCLTCQKDLGVGEVVEKRKPIEEENVVQHINKKGKFIVRIKKESDQISMSIPCISVNGAPAVKVFPKSKSIGSTGIQEQFAKDPAVQIEREKAGASEKSTVKVELNGNSKDIHEAAAESGSPSLQLEKRLIEDKGENTLILEKSLPKAIKAAAEKIAPSEKAFSAMGSENPSSTTTEALETQKIYPEPPSQDVDGKMNLRSRKAKDEPLTAKSMIPVENGTEPRKETVPSNENSVTNKQRVNGYEKKGADAKELTGTVAVTPKHMNSTDLVNNRLRTARVVWTKFVGTPWWPGKCASKQELLDEINSLEAFLKTEEKEREKERMQDRINQLKRLDVSTANKTVLVRLYGNDRWGYVAPEYIKPFEKYFRLYAKNKRIWGKTFEEDEDGDIGWPSYESPLGRAQEVRCSFCMSCDRVIPKHEVNVISCSNCQAWTYIGCMKGKQLPCETENFYCAVCQVDLDVPEVGKPQANGICH